VSKPALSQVAVLMATYNGAPWLAEQLDSVARQAGVAVRLLVSDDESTDGTRSILQDWAQHQKVPLRTCHPPTRCGSAGRNFYHLLAHAPLGDAQYVALADQDDRWMPGKLARAIHGLAKKGCSGYSSNVQAWYPDRPPESSTKLVNKAQPQVRYDHLFQGPGPGCTFVMSRAHFETLRQFVRQHWETIQDITYHDWLIYAHARETGLRWHIDAQPSVAYRQHEHNALGASMGRKGIFKRMRMLREGWLGDQTLRIARLFGKEAVWPVSAFARLGLTDRIKLALNAHQFRRGCRDRLALAVAVLLVLRRSTKP
jgi:rhamnosyltransferase